ncbi:MAG: class 1 fructose-bisphosphatase, partial [Anaerolineae bacterium]|nr:class 1 fructose-bisphosphatase [Anaerolineae bacterium]
MVKLVTIERHILDQQKLYPDATGTFSQVLYDIALSAKIIARETTRAGLFGILGASEDHNVYG